MASCHICLEQNSSLADVDQQILESIKDIFGIEIPDGQKLRICDLCTEHLKKFHEFYAKTKQNLTKILSVIERESKCDENSVSQDELIKDEISFETSEDQNVIKSDNKRTTSKNNASCNKALVKNENYDCSCGKSYKSRISLLQHQRKNLPKCNHNTAFLCQLCNKNYYNIKTLERHIKKYHSTTSNSKISLFPGIWTCDICQKTFETRNGIKKHIEEKHLRIHETICNYCGITINFYDLAQHIFLKHNQDRKREKCLICNKYFLGLKAHNKRNHLDEGIFTCAVCGLTFNNRLKLSVHNWRKHPVKGKYTCKECGKECSNSLKLKEHMQAAHIGGFL